MSEVDLDDKRLPGDTGGEEKMVPVAEAIRYRKRAQSAEKEAAGLTDEVARLRRTNEELSAEVRMLQADAALATALVAAGVIDLEAATLMARSRMDKEGNQDPTAVVAALQKEKAWLFRPAAATPAAARTAGIREPRPNAQKMLEDAARQAAASGSRADVHEYMRRRRKLV